jgi:hypothetical protein
MPDYAHLLLHPKTVPLPRIMRDPKSKTDLALSKLGTAQAQSGKPVFDFICRRTRDFSNKLDYIHRIEGLRPRQAPRLALVKLPPLRKTRRRSPNP